MPDFNCPNCNARLREEDCQGWTRPNTWMGNGRRTSLVMRWDCWRCSWVGEWIAESVSAPETVAVK